jgi:hypothetical protein
MAEPWVELPDETIVGTNYRVNKFLGDRVNRLIAEAPPELQADLMLGITSGYRTHEQQMKAYLNHLAGGGLAAAPGHSWHERDHGMAVDWNHLSPTGWAYLKSHAGEYGLGFPLGSKDPFHMQPVETYGGPQHYSHLSVEGVDPRIMSALLNVGWNESRMRNVRNYRYDDTHTANGYYQITDTNWRHYAPKIGISAKTAMDASFEDQTRVAAAMVRENGLKPWDKAHGGSIPVGEGLSSFYLSGDSGGGNDEPPVHMPVPRPINPVPSGGPKVSDVLVTKPVQLDPPPAPAHLHAPAAPRAPNLASTFMGGLRSILSTR